MIFVASNASFVIWTTSGLENGLFAMLISLAMLLILKYASEEIPTAIEAGKIGAVIGLAALTRPDGAIYILSLPVILLTTFNVFNKAKFIHAGKSIFGFAGAFALTYGSYFVFRLAYFGSMHPNTYYAKGGLRPSMRNPHQLLNSLFGVDLWIPFGIIMLVLLANAYRRSKPQWRQHVALWNLVFLALIAFGLMPSDWMGEFRFATPFFVLLATTLAVEVKTLIDYAASRFNLSPSIRMTLVGVIVLPSLGFYLFEHYPRLTKFYGNPVVTFERIANTYAYPFNSYAEKLGLKDASFLVPDLGGTLYYSKLKIYDLAGLCDKTIARLHPRKQPAFYDYVFDEIKPTFIHTHGYFTSISQFDTDDRFARDYVWISEYEDTYAGKQLNRKIMSGNFIRRDALPDGENSLRLIRPE